MAEFAPSTSTEAAAYICLLASILNDESEDKALIKSFGKLVPAAMKDAMDVVAQGEALDEAAKTAAMEVAGTLIL